MKYSFEAVERIPKPLAPGIVYVSEEFGVGALLCACGCGHKVSLIVPESHQVRVYEGAPTISPSISVCDGPCRSHFFIRRGEVDWCPAFSEEECAETMRAQIAWHATAAAAPGSWAGRLRGAISALWRRLKYLVGA